jgi:cytochrome c2
MKLLTLCTLMFMSVNASAFDGAGYFQANCKSCHTIGGGDTVGPDLAGISKRRKIEWVVKFMNYPEGMISGDVDEPGYEKPDKLAMKIYEQYKPSVMTEFSVDKKQVQAIFTYIDSLEKKPKGKILKIK